MAQRKTKPAKRHTQRGVAVHRPASTMALQQARDLVEQDDLALARQVLETLDLNDPGQPAALLLLGEVYTKMAQHGQASGVYERLCRLYPRDLTHVLLLIQSYMKVGCVALARRTLLSVRGRFADLPGGESFDQGSAQIEELVQARIAGGHLTLSGLETEEQYERAQVLLLQQRFEQARKVLQALLRKEPDHVAALRTLALCLFSEGALDEATAVAQQIVLRSPGEAAPLADLICFLCRSGKFEQARQLGEDLRRLPAAPGDAARKAQALSMIGDDRGVLAVAAEGTDEDPGAATLHHLAAVAALRLGDEPAARASWHRALALPDPPQEVRANLDDLGKQEGERNGPWPFAISHWLSLAAMTQLRNAMRDGKSLEIRRARLREVLKKRPEIVAIMGGFFECGDATSRDVALEWTRLSRAPDAVKAMCSFALGGSGTDADRLAAARAAVALGALPIGMTRMWRSGLPDQEVLVLEHEVSSQPRPVHPPHVHKLAESGHQALLEGDYDQAGHFLNQALRLAPDAPDLCNNLISAYTGQGRFTEAEALTRQNFARHPDYFFGRIAMAQLLLREGKPEEAEELVAPLVARRRLHTSELIALCLIQVEAQLGRGRTGLARAWLKYLEEKVPNNPHLARYRDLVEHASTTQPPSPR